MKLLYMFVLSLSLSASAFASRECDWSQTVNEKDPVNIGNTNVQITFKQSLIEREKDTLNKELYPQLEAWQHTISVYGKNSETAKQAQLAVADAINYLKGSIITDRSVKLVLDRMSRKFLADRPLANQIRDAIPKMKIPESKRTILEQWAQSVALLESTQPTWDEAEREVLAMLPNSNVSIADKLVERLQDLNAHLESNLKQLDNGRTQDLGKKEEIEKAILDVQAKISKYLDEIALLQKAIDGWQAQLRQWSPVSAFCPAPMISHVVR